MVCGFGVYGDMTFLSFFLSLGNDYFVYRITKAKTSIRPFMHCAETNASTRLSVLFPFVDDCKIPELSAKECFAQAIHIP